MLQAVVVEHPADQVVSVAAHPYQAQVMAVQVADQQHLRPQRALPDEAVVVVEQVV
jgi:hypothetical protein